MSAAAQPAALEAGATAGRRLPPAAVVLAFVIVSILIAKFIAPLDVWPQDWLVPVRGWVTAFFAWFSAVAKPVTRAISWVLSLPLALVEALLYRGIPNWKLPPLPWIAIVFGVGVLGHWIAGMRLALFCAGCTFYLAIFGLWPDAMQTLAIVLVTVPLAAITGLLLGVWATRNPRIENVLNGIFDIMQATPHMAYLGPVVILFGFGQVPAMLATLGFAVPPMARLTILGIRTVPSDILEVGPDVGVHAAPAFVEGGIAFSTAGAASGPQSGCHANACHGGDRLAGGGLGARSEASVFAAAAAGGQGG